MYTEYISKLHTALQSDDFESIDHILETIYMLGLPDSDIGKIDDILTEATLYSEFKDAEYKEKALEMIKGIMK